MAMTDIVTRVKTLLHGSGLMEKPPIIRVASNAAETITNPTLVFSLLAGEGAASGVSEGDILSTMQGSTAALSFVFYVLGVSTDVVTCTSTYMGSTASTTASSCAFAAIRPSGRRTPSSRRSSASVANR